MNITNITAAYGVKSPSPATGTTRSAAQSQETRAALTLPPLECPTPEMLARETASFSEAVGNKFREAGIQMPPEPVLGSDSQGYVTVANDHPDRAKIEKMFKDNPELRDQFAKISAGSSLQRAAEGYTEFAAEYERLQNDPAAQAALVNARIAHNSQPFFMTISANGAEPFFAGFKGVSA